MKERDRVLTKERRKGKARFEDEHQSISSVDEGQFEASITPEDLYNTGGVLAGGRITPTINNPLTQSAGAASTWEEGAAAGAGASAATGSTRTGSSTNTSLSSSATASSIGNSREQGQSATKKRTSFPIGGHLANMLNLSPHRRRPSLQTRLSGNLSSSASPASASSTTPSSAGGNSAGGASNSSSSGGGMMNSIVGAGAIAGAIGSGGGGGGSTGSFVSGSHGNNGDSTGGGSGSNGLGSDQPISGRSRSSISQATPSSATTPNTATPTTSTTAASLSSLSSLSSSSTPRSSSISSNPIATQANLANLRTLRSPGVTSMTAFASTSVPSSLSQSMDRLAFRDSPTTPGFESSISARNDDEKYQRRYAGSYTMPATFDEDWDSAGEDDEDGHNGTNRIADAQRILSSSTSIQDDGGDREDRYPAYKLEDARHVAKSRSNSTTSSRDPFADKSSNATPIADTRHSRRLGQNFDLHPSQRAPSDVSLSHSASEPPSRPGSVPPRPGQQTSSNKSNKENDSTSTPSASSSLRASSLNQIAALKQQRAAENPPRSSSSNSSSEALSIASKSPSLLHKDTHRSKTAARTAQLYEKRHPHSLEPPLPDPLAPKVDPAPSSGMYWYRTPSHGLETVPVRAHTCTLVGSSIFVFGGCDSKSCFNDLYVFDADSMFWSRPQTHGDIPPPLRAMTATAVGKKIVIFGGGDGPTYYNDLYILDTVTHRYTKPKVPGTLPSKRRAHTACLYKSGLYIFGGGDGVRALNDVWRLDVADLTKISWKLISSPTSSINMSERSASATSLVSSNISATPSTTLKLKPTARGYHTANMVQNKLIIFGGSDGVECFRDVWVFDVETAVWKCVEIKASFPRLSHTSTIIGSYLFVVGGHDGAEYSNEVLLLNLGMLQKFLSHVKTITIKLNVKYVC